MKDTGDRWCQVCDTGFIAAVEGAAVCPACRAKVEAYEVARRAVEAAEKRIAELEANSWGKGGAK